jgi:hypothetical protein
MSLVRGTVAPEGGDTETPRAAFALTESGRRDLDPSTWLRPLPPTLWRRLPEQDRDAHERLAHGLAEAVGRAHEAAATARATTADDERALRAALTAGERPPKPKAPAAEQAAEQAKHEAVVAAELVIESGGELVRKFGDDEMSAAIGEAEQAAREVIARMPAQVDALHDALREVSELGGEARWLAQLLERRHQLPWRPTSAPYSQRMAQAGHYAAELAVYVAAELDEQAWRDAPPPEHTPPRGAPAPGTWTSSGIDPTK